MDRHDVRADAVDRGPHCHQHPRQVLHVRLGCGVADHGGPARERRGHQCVLGAHHRRLVHQKVAGPQPERRLQLDVPVTGDGRAERPEGVQVRVQAAAPDHVAPRRGHVRDAEARQERAREQERCPDALGELGIDLVAVVDARCVDRDLAGSQPMHAGSQALQQHRHRLDVADPRDVAQDHLVVSQQAGRQDRQRSVLVAGRDDRAGERYSPFDYELLHRDGS